MNKIEQMEKDIALLKAEIQATSDYYSIFLGEKLQLPELGIQKVSLPKDSVWTRLHRAMYERSQRLKVLFPMESETEETSTVTQRHH